MKRILLFLMVLSVSALWTSSSAQTLNQAANWPNVAWALNGTYDASALLSDPTSTTNFSYDDDAAGSGSTDILNAESPVIDLSAAHTAGETSLIIEYDYDYNFGDVFDLEYYDAAAAAWVGWEAIPDNSSTQSGWCAAIAAPIVTSAELDISGFTATQQSGFRYRFAYDASSEWGWGFCVSSPTIKSVLPTQPPNCATVVAPTDGQMNLPIGVTTLKWTASAMGEPATSFEVFIGTTSGSLSSFTTTVEDTLNVNLLAEGTTFYWQVVPSSAGGPATGCPEWSFTTGYHSPSATQTGAWCDDFSTHTSGTGTTTNGWASNPTSGFAWTVATGGTTPSGSTGPSTDNTGDSHYIFTEASSGSDGSVATLFSPNLDISGMTAPQVAFYYHMYGAVMGDLHVDVFNGTTYDMDAFVLTGQQQGAQGDAWIKGAVDLTSYSGTVFLRFRGIRGADF